jgi:hypothetical protein
VNGTRITATNEMDKMWNESITAYLKAHFPLRLKRIMKKHTEPIF